MAEETGADADGDVRGRPVVLAVGPDRRTPAAPVARRRAVAVLLVAAAVAVVATALAAAVAVVVSVLGPPSATLWSDVRPAAPPCGLSADGAGPPDFSAPTAPPASGR